jgi:hypothetical protein
MTVFAPGTTTPRTAPVTTVPVRGAADRALDFITGSVGPAGAPSAVLSLDPRFGQSFPGSLARGVLLKHFGVDPGFDLEGEAFSAMVSLMLLPPPARRDDRRMAGQLTGRLTAQVRACRWRERYRFFPGTGGFPADTDCTALATSALHDHGLLTTAGLDRGVRELLRSTPPATEPASPPGPCGEESVNRDVFMVYWEDGQEPATLRRGRKHDAVACANALYTVQLAPRPLTGETCAVIDATTRYLKDHLSSGRYLAGTRYYPSPDAFLYAVSRLCARFPASARVLAAPARQALAEREAPAASAAVRVPASALEIALRALAADHLGLSAGQDGRRMRLATTQLTDGSWPAAAYYRMGRFPVYFGSPYLTTVFAMTALRPRATSGGDTGVNSPLSGALPACEVPSWPGP